MTVPPPALTVPDARSLGPATPAARFAVASSLLVVAYVALPAHPAAEVVVVAVVAASALAVVVGVATYEPDRRSSWLFVATALGLHALAAGVRGWELAGSDGSTRSEALAMLAYPPMLVGVWGLSARRLPSGFADRRWVIATTTVCGLVWLLVVQPTLADGTVPWRAADRVGVLAVLDAVAVTVVGRRLTASHERSGALLLVTAALVLWGDAHAVVGSQIYDGTFVATSVAAGSVLLGPMLLGVAALRPDMATTAPWTDESWQWQRRAVRELVVAAVIVVAVTATTMVAATGTASVLFAAGLIAVAVVAIGAGDGGDRPDAASDPQPPAADGSTTACTSHVASSETGARAAFAPPPPVHPAAFDTNRRLDLDLDWIRSTAGIAGNPKADELELVHLPYVELGTGVVVGVEALVRWRHPVRGALAPAEFFGTSDRSSSVRIVDDWTVTEAIATASSWRTAALVGINIGPARLSERAWVDHLLEQAEVFGVATDRIVVETTERAFLDEQAATFAQARRLRDAGVHVAIDDFGREVGSLRSLVKAPVDIVKIRTGPLGRSRTEIDAAGISAIVATGHRTAIVGVDDPGLLGRARELGIDIGQGFALSRPLPAEIVRRRFETGCSAGAARGSRVGSVSLGTA